MKAVFFHQHGGPGVLEFGELPIPDPGPGQVLIRLKTAALNRLDLWVRNGWPGIKLLYPHIPGADGAGEVVTTGSGVTGWLPGDRVVINSNLSCGACDECRAGHENRCRNWGLIGETCSGTYAEYIVVPATNLYPIPAGFSEESAAAAGLVYQTAWHSLVRRANVSPGETVLVVGSSGGVNSASIQIARFLGAKVIAIGSNAVKCNLALSLGADDAIDRSRDENWPKAVYQLTDRRGVDVIVDNVGTTFPQSFRAAGKGCRIVTVGNTGGALIEIDNRYIFSKHLSIFGSTMGARQDFEDVMDLVFTGKLLPVVDKSFPLSEARLAQAYLENGEQLGKIILRIDESL